MNKIVNIRKGFFETSSSSMHSYFISDSGDLVNDLPRRVIFDEWKPKENKFNDTYSKLNYLIAYFFWGKTFNHLRYADWDDLSEEEKESVKPSEDDEDLILYKKLEKIVKDFSGSEIVVKNGDYDLDSFCTDQQILHLSEDEIKNWLFNPLSTLEISEE